MKKYILLAVICIFSIGKMLGQDEPKFKKILIYDDKERDIQITLGSRLISDMAYLNSDFTPLKSGAKLTEARVRTSFTYNDWYFYADFDFGSGKVKQKDLFLRYQIKDEAEKIQSVKVGYYAEPFSMNLNTSRYSVHFITRPAPINALGNGRALGVSYKYIRPYFFSNQGIFSENLYNNQRAGNQGFSVSGRYLGRMVTDNNIQLHAGVSLRYAKLGGGVIDEKTQILETEEIVSAPLENQLDRNSEFLNAKIPWADENYKIGFEALAKTDKFFIRGEYTFDKITKSRPDQKLFEAQLGGLWSWTTLKSWQGGNPLDDTSLQGGYVELGYLISGSKYTYNKKNAIIDGLFEKGALEVVARYSYTDLNDIKDGDVFLKGKNKFYPNGKITDYPATSTSIAGGKSHMATLGLNYVFNRHAKLLVAYTFTNLDNVYLPNDSNFNMLQARLMVAF